MKQIEVVAAVIKYQNKYLCCKRNPKGEVGNKWEFPGGKIERNETHVEALKRELLEELNMIIDIDEFLLTVKHQYNTFHLTMHAYCCQVESDYFDLKEHSDAKWLDINGFDFLDWAEADKPIVNLLKSNN